MAATQESFSENGSSGASSTATGNRPTGTVDGNGLLAQVCANGNVSVDTVPSGWTLEGNCNGSGNQVQMFIYKKIASSEPASWDWTLSGATSNSVNVYRLSGADGTDIVDVSAFSSNLGSGTSFDAPAVTTTEADELVYRFIAGDRDQDPYTIATSTVQTTNAYNGASGHSDGAATFTQATAASTGTETWTADAADEACTATVAIKSAAAAAAGFVAPSIRHPQRNPLLRL